MLVKRLSDTVTLGGWKFNRIKLEDMSLFSEYTAQSEYPVNLWSSSFAYLWAVSKSKRKKILWIMLDGMLAAFAHTSKGALYLYCLPFGKGDAAHVMAVIEKAMRFCYEFNGRDGKKVQLRMVNEAQLNFLKTGPGFDKKFRTVIWQGIERHYSVGKLVELKGKEFENIRNRINKFHRDNPGAVVCEYKATDFEQVMEVGNDWKNTFGKKYSRLLDKVYFRQIMLHCIELRQTTLVIKIDGAVIGMVSGGRLPSGQAWGSLVKFNEGIPGLSETLIVEYARKLREMDPGIEYLNVGSDLGAEGLRNYKLKFKPVLNLKRYRVFLK